jgi:hypothetical protein
MTINHPIIPPPELVQQWYDNMGPDPGPFESFAIAAARWAADQELEACVEWLIMSPVRTEEYLRAARRPKPLSLKEQALQALDQADKGLNKSEWQQRSDTIRRALEQLP